VESDDIMGTGGEKEHIHQGKSHIAKGFKKRKKNQSQRQKKGKELRARSGSTSHGEVGGQTSKGGSDGEGKGNKRKE